MPRYRDFEYSHIYSGIKISKYTGSATTVNIPYSIDRLPVTFIGDFAFWGYNSLTNVTIPSSVTSIGNLAFSDCSSLESIEIPSSVTSIGNSAFRGCSSLKSIKIPSSVTSIGECAFSDCSSLESIEIPSSVTSIGECAFRDCSSLKSIKIPSSVTSIGSGAFSACSSLETIIYPSKKIFFITPFVWEQINSINVRINSFVGKAFILTIPSQINNLPVTSIGDFAFWNCKSLTSIKIPSSITSIGDLAFTYCSSLENIEIPGSVTSIGNSAFRDCNSLRSIKIPSSVTSIGERAFEGCSSLTSITIPDSVTSIGKKSFNGCSSLESVNIPEVVKSIDKWAFKGCSSLTSITIPNSVTSIGAGAFSGCGKLSVIYLHKSLKDVASVNNGIKSFIDRYSNKIHYYNFSPYISNKINGLKNKPNISTELLNFVNQIELSLAKSYMPELNDSIEKIFDEIETAYHKRQEIDSNPVINLINLTNAVSETKVRNALDYIQKFYDEIAEFEARVKNDIEALEEEKNAILKQNDPRENFKYTLSQSKGVQISKYIGNATSVVIPEQIENLPVTSIGYKAFDNPDLRKVVIPKSVKSIVYCAFVSQQPMHVLFQGDSIKIIPQSFLTPQITFYYTNNAIAGILYSIADNNPKYNVNYNAADFDKI